MLTPNAFTDRMFALSARYGEGAVARLLGGFRCLLHRQMRKKQAVQNESEARNASASSTRL